MSKTLLGCDPEILLTNKEGMFVSSLDKFGGTKSEPKPVPRLGKGFYLQEDNVALEYNIPPSPNPAKFLENNFKMFNYVKELVSKKNLSISDSPSGVYTKEELDHPLAHVFGCEPDYNAWKLDFNPKPVSDNPNLRCAGGHIHIGKKMSKIDSINLVRLLDYWVGTVLAALEPVNERRKLYGSPGSLRFKPYGVEWRTPSNNWIFSPELTITMSKCIYKLAEEYEYNMDSFFFKKKMLTYEEVEKLYSSPMITYDVLSFWLSNAEEVNTKLLLLNCFKNSSEKERDKANYQAKRDKYFKVLWDSVITNSTIEETQKTLGEYINKMSAYQMLYSKSSKSNLNF